MIGRPRATCENELSGQPRGGYARARSRWIVLAAFVFSSLALSGCTLDFDKFDASATPDASPRPDTDSEQDTLAGEDADTTPNADAQDPADSAQDAAAPDSGGVAERCDDDADCGGDLFCMGGYCTLSCAQGAPCPDGSSCHQFNFGSYAGESVCLADCAAESGSDIPTSCAGVAGRDDLDCVTPNQWPPEPLTADSESACLPDSDGDGVPDPMDNCPDEPNAQQTDRDADGLGDACDPEPACHQMAVEGILDYGTIDYPADDFFIPQSSDENWVPVVGGVDEDGKPVRSAVMLDRLKGEWKTLPDLPFAALDRHIIASAPGKYLLTPGRLGDEVGDYDQAVELARDGSSELLDFQPDSLHDGIYAHAMGHRLVTFGYDDETGDESTLLRVKDKSGASQVMAENSYGERVNWHATTSLQGEALIYSDIFEDTGVMRLLRVNQPADDFRVSSLVLPSTAAVDGADFSPFLIPTGGHIIYAMDKPTGTMLRVNLQNYTSTHVPHFDLDIEANDPRFISMVDALSFIVLDRPEGEPEKLRAREYFLGCIPAYQSVDTDGDGIPDIIDNCPLVANPDQSDIDFDRLGDVCDPDADGDGIPNSEDFILADDGETVISTALDTDNDGVPNVDDEDSDGDGIPDIMDRYPIDTDNDGLPNAYDSDIDGDGYSNEEELAAGSDPLNPLSFPGSGYLTYIRADGSDRSVEFAPLDALLEPAQIATESSEKPHQPRFANKGRHILVLSGAPQRATGVELLPTPGEDPADAQTIDLGVELRGAGLPNASIDDEGEPQSIYALHAAEDEPDQWRLSKFDLADLSATTLFTDALSELRALSASSGYLAFLAGPAGCEDCLQPYRLTASSDSINRLSSGPQAPRSVHLNIGNGMSFLVDDPHGDGLIGWYAGDFYRPPGIVELDSLVATDTSPAHLIASGRRDAQSPYELWLYNGRTEKWQQILQAPEDLIEVDWLRDLPDDEPIGPS